MFKRKFYLTFLLMFIATLILTTMTSDADEELTLPEGVILVNHKDIPVG